MYIDQVTPSSNTTKIVDVKDVQYLILQADCPLNSFAVASAFASYPNITVTGRINGVQRNIHTGINIMLFAETLASLHGGATYQAGDTTHKVGFRIPLTVGFHDYEHSFASVDIENLQIAFSNWPATAAAPTVIDVWAHQNVQDITPAAIFEYSQNTKGNSQVNTGGPGVQVWAKADILQSASGACGNLSADELKLTASFERAVVFQEIADSSSANAVFGYNALVPVPTYDMNVTLDFGSSEAFYIVARVVPL